MADLTLSKIIVPKTARNGRIYNLDVVSTSSNSTVGSSSVGWADVTDDLITIDRDIHINGNITANEEITAWFVTGATTPILSGLTVSLPLLKNTETNILLDYDTSTLSVVGGKLTVIGGTSGSTGSTSISINTSTPNGLSLTGSTLSLALASISNTGALSSTNWNTFNNKEPAITAGSTSQYWRGDKSWQTLPTTLPASDVYSWAKQATKPSYTKSDVGLSNVDNTADTAKPVSTAQQSALDLKANSLNPSLSGTVTSILSSVGVGTVSNSAGGTTVTGVGTYFLNTLNVGDTITINGQTVTITAITSNTVMTTTAITSSNSGVPYTIVGGEKLTIKPNGNILGTSFQIKNNSGTVKWIIAIDSSTDNLIFKNASGVLEAQLTQAGNLSVKGELTAYSTFS